MTLKKVIEILENLSIAYPYLRGGDESDAIELGIEALKRIIVIRNSWPKYTSDLLPGETKE